MLSKESINSTTKCVHGGSIMEKGCKGSKVEL